MLIIMSNRASTVHVPGDKDQRQPLSPRTNGAGPVIRCRIPGPASFSKRTSGLLDRLDLQRYRPLVADDRTARFQRQVDVDAEVLTVQHHRRLEAGDLTVAHARVDAVEVQVERDPPGHALEGELTA